MAGRKPKYVPPGCYEAALVELDGRPGDDPASTILTVRLKVTHSRDPGGERMVGRQVESELVLESDAESVAGRIDDESLARWASWITSGGWMIVTA